MSVSNKSFSSLLQALSQDYYTRRLSFDEYCEKRRALLNQIDQYFNGVIAIEESPRPAQVHQVEISGSVKPGDTMTFTVQFVVDVK